MMPLPPHIEPLIVPCLEGTATEAEVALVRAWLAENPANQVVWKQWEDLYFQVPATDLSAEWPNEDVAWQRFNSAAVQPAAKVVPLATSPGGWRKWAAAAAVTLLVGTATWWWWRTPAVTQMAATTTIVNDTLPDGTTLSLNKASSLTYQKDKRTALLKGEAYFRVDHNHEQRFTVEAGPLTIIDIGTAFYVSARENSDSILVTVTEGSVQVLAPDGLQWTLKQGEGVLYTRSGKFDLQFPGDAPITGSWREKKFKFRNDRLDKVISKLNEVYDETIQLSDQALGACRITVTFQDETPESIARIIAETMQWNLRPTPTGWLLEGEGCMEEW